MHQTKQIFVTILKECHPEVVIIHFGDQMGLTFERDALAQELFVRKIDVTCFEIENRSRMIKSGDFGRLSISLTPSQLKNAILGTEKRNSIPSMSR